MTALKTYLPTLAICLGKKGPVQLNQWLQALVASDVLVPRPGRGPGSGVELTSRSVATMILALLGSDLRSEAVQRAKSLVKYRPCTDDGKCMMTGATSLRDAIAVGLEQDSKWHGVMATLVTVTVMRNQNTAELKWRHKEGDFIQQFASKQRTRERLSVKAVLEVRETQKIVADVRHYLAGNI